MYKNYIKIALRNLKSNKIFSFINIAGLTLGLTTCLLIGIFVKDELEFDKFIPDGNNIYRVYDAVNNNGEIQNKGGTSPMFAPTLKQEFPEVLSSTRLLQIQSKVLLEAANKKIYEEKGIMAESSFFDVFKLPLLYGSKKDALDDPGSIILSDQLAQKYFGNENPIGKQILYEKTPLLIKGVFKSNSKFHLSINFIVSIANEKISEDRMHSWQWQQFFTYIKLKNGTDAGLLQRKFEQVVKERAYPITKEMGFTYLPVFQPLNKIHLYSSDIIFDMAVKGNIQYVKSLIIIALFILIIACFNFINLTTAKSLKRAKEVGLRKTIGASRKQLIIQFTGEAMLIALISVVMALCITALIIPTLNQFTNKNIAFISLINWNDILAIISITLIVGLLSGFYPALILSNFQPVKVLKGVITDPSSGKLQWMRKGLVIVQFTLTGILIISAIVVYQQVDFLHNKNLGFKKDQIMFFPMRGDNMYKNYISFKNELLKAPGVSSVSIGYGFPGDLVAGDEVIVPQNGINKSMSATQLMVDQDYIKTLNLQLIAGRDFDKNIITDKDQSFIINETAVKDMGFKDPQKAIGHTLMWKVWGAKNPDSLKKGQIIGVVKDFNYKSLYEKVGTAVLQIFPDANYKVAVKLSGKNIESSVSAIKRKWDTYSPDYPIEYNFLDENFDKMYKAEDKMQTLFTIFTGIAIFVGCMGLFGLATYNVERRAKEIGIRKVLGASVSNIITLLSAEFVKLVVVAIVVASPVAWYFMHAWLQNYAYRITISWKVFLLASSATLCISLLTVGFQSVRTALQNPVKSIKSE